MTHNLPDELAETVRDLDEAVDEAREEGYPDPPDITLKNARTLLAALYSLQPRPFSAYPTADREIALQTGKPGSSVLLLCEADGALLCLVHLNGRHRSIRYSEAPSVPTDFIRDALNDLDNQPEA